MQLKRLRPLIGAVIGLALLVWALRNLDWGQMGRTLRSAQYALLVPSALAMLGMFGIRSVRWKMLLKPLGSLDFTIVGACVLIGYFGNFALTANAGELVRTFVLSKSQGLSKSSVLASIVVEKTLDISVLVALLLILSSTMALPPWMQYLGIVGGAMAALACTFLVLLPRFAKGIATWVRTQLTRVSAPLAVRVEHLIGAFARGSETWVQGRAIVSTVVLTCLTWLLLALTFYFIGASLGLAIPRLAYLLLVTLITLGAIVPALPGQVGTMEFLVVGGLSVFSVSKELALSFAILLRLVRLVPLSLGYASLVREGVRLSDVSSF
jgi:uncharacterized protein (TIRG00374 family)